MIDEFQEHSSEEIIPFESNSTFGEGAASFDMLGPNGLIDHFDIGFFDESYTYDENDGYVVGNPGEDSKFWEPQSTGFTCAIQAQRSIIEAFTGEPISEAQLVYDATVAGHLTEDGMSPYDIGSLLNAYGVPSHQVDNATIGDIVSELAAGHKVIVGVDSGELWGEDSILEDFFGQAADHAVWITGIRENSDGGMTVILNDSGDPEGAGKEYDLDKFVDAWEDSGGFYVATDFAPDNLAEEVDGFDPETGVFGALRDVLQEKLGSVATVVDTEEAGAVIESAERVAGAAGSAIARDFLTTLATTFDVHSAAAIGISSGLAVGGAVLLNEVENNNLIENLTDVGRNLMLEML